MNTQIYLLVAMTKLSFTKSGNLHQGFVTQQFSRRPMVLPPPKSMYCSSSVDLDTFFNERRMKYLWILLQDSLLDKSQPKPQGDQSSTSEREPASQRSASAPTSGPVSSSEPVPASSHPPVAEAARPRNILPVDRLLQNNKDVYDKLIDHPFPKSLGDGSASLDGFRYYLIVRSFPIYHPDCVLMFKSQFKSNSRTQSTWSSALA